MPVLIPFAERILVDAGPSEQQAFLSLVSASALLHQHQRLKQDQYILAVETDFQIAKDLSQGLFAKEGDELSSNAVELLGMLGEWGLKEFTVTDLVMKDSRWYRKRYLRALKELTRLDLVIHHRQRTGKPSSFSLVDGAWTPRPEVQILLQTESFKAGQRDKSGTAKKTGPEGLGDTVNRNY